MYLGGAGRGSGGGAGCRVGAGCWQQADHCAALVGCLGQAVAGVVCAGGSGGVAAGWAVVSIFEGGR